MKRMTTLGDKKNGLHTLHIPNRGMDRAEVHVPRKREDEDINHVGC